MLDFLPSKDIWSLLFVSKSSYALALPFLYRTISFEWNPIPIRRIILLCRAVFQYPDHASRIHHVEFVSHEKVDSLDPWEAASYVPLINEQYLDMLEVIEQAQAIIHDANFPDADYWVYPLRDGNAYAFASVFLSQLHNLRSLRLDYSFVWQGGFPGLMLYHAISSSAETRISKFRHLTEVDYGGNVRLSETFEDFPTINEGEGYPLCDPDQFPAWFYLPSLKSLTIWLRTKESFELPDLPSNLPSLEKLILARTTINENQVPQLLSSTTSLKTLHLGMAYEWGREGALKNSLAITQGLISVGNTLTNLSIGVEYYPPNSDGFELRDEDRDRTKPFYGLLKQFPNLRAVEVPIQLLVGWDTKPWVDLSSALPHTVEQLGIRGDYQTWDENGWQEGEMLDMVGNNASKLRAHMPGLKTICVRTWRQYWSTPTIDQSREMARGACSREGIDLVVFADHFSAGVWTDNRSCPERVFR